jgi:hypothetical protein
MRLPTLGGLPSQIWGYSETNRDSNHTANSLILLSKSPLDSFGKHSQFGSYSFLHVILQRYVLGTVVLILQQL